jgi:hypothetical protein
MDKSDTLTLTLTSDELALLAMLLEGKQKVLLAEIRHTSRREFRDCLRDRLTLVENILSRLPAPALQD